MSQTEQDQQQDPSTPTTQPKEPSKDPKAASAGTPSTDPSTPSEEPPPPTPLETAREALMRCSRSQQLAVPDLLLILGLVDAAIEKESKSKSDESGQSKSGDSKNGDSGKSGSPSSKSGSPMPKKAIKDAQGKERPITLADVKLSSEGAPTVQLQPVETLVDAEPAKAPADASGSADAPPPADSTSADTAGVKSTTFTASSKKKK